jgi:hypothetical protein
LRSALAQEMPSARCVASYVWGNSALTEDLYPCHPCVQPLPAEEPHSGEIFGQYMEQWLKAVAAISVRNGPPSFGASENSDWPSFAGQAIAGSRENQRTVLFLWERQVSPQIVEVTGRGASGRVEAFSAEHPNVTIRVGLP